MNTHLKKQKEKIVLGIDPGTHRLGYAILKIAYPTKTQILDYGTKELKKNSSFYEAILFAHKNIRNLIRKHKPNLVCIEELFFQKNLKTASKVLQVRGVILLDCLEENIPVVELTATQVKKGISGSGRSDKKQIKKAIELIFKLPKQKGLDDSFDAIAIAFVGARLSTSLRNQLF
ncbi:MAG: crossover junction endodeoxyribonuclease RuvC [Leptospiraceae bacterium]|nr:crossover junction endodeoxyribonuclease RuvC [Leptospiraceae bacterium]